MKKIILILLIIGLITILFVSCIPSVPPPPSEGEGEEEVEPPTSRVVLVELFNTRGCPACAQINPIVEEVAQEYDKSQVILIEEAAWGPYSTPETSERYRWYLPESKERTTPNILFNGLNQRMHPGASAGGGEGPTNHRPIINSTPPTTATVDIVYSYQVMATDADGDSLAYSLNTAPEGMVIEVNTGLLTWTPTEEQVGEQEVEVEVSDGKKAAKQEFIITVEDTEDAVHNVSTITFEGAVSYMDKTFIKAGEADITVAFNVPTEPVRVFVKGESRNGGGESRNVVGIPDGAVEVAMTTTDNMTYVGTYDFRGDCIEYWIYILIGESCCPVVCSRTIMVDGEAPCIEITALVEECEIGGICPPVVTGELIRITNDPTEYPEGGECEDGGPCCCDDCTEVAGWEMTLYCMNPFHDDPCCETPDPATICGQASGTDCVVDFSTACGITPPTAENPWYVHFCIWDILGNERCFWGELFDGNFQQGHFETSGSACEFVTNVPFFHKIYIPSYPYVENWIGFRDCNCCPICPSPEQ